MKKDIFIRSIRIESGRTGGPAPLVRELRRADDFIRAAVRAGAGALDSGIEADPCRTGIFLGTTIGPLETNFRFLDTLFDNGEGQGSPTLFSHSVHNSAVGYLSRLLNLKGPVLTVTTPGWPFLAALVEAEITLKSLEIEAALVLAVEEESPMLTEVLERLQNRKEEGDSHRSCRLGAVAWLLTYGGSGIAPRLRMTTLEENPCDPVFYLQRGEEYFSSVLKEEDRRRFPWGLAAPLSLSRALQKSSHRQEKSLSWTAKAAYGRASVLIDF